MALGYREGFWEDNIIREKSKAQICCFESVGICVLIEKDVSLLFFCFILFLFSLFALQIPIFHLIILYIFCKVFGHISNLKTYMAMRCVTLQLMTAKTHFGCHWIKIIISEWDQFTLTKYYRKKKIVQCFSGYARLIFLFFYVFDMFYTSHSIAIIYNFFSYH